VDIEEFRFDQHDLALLDPREAPALILLDLDRFPQEFTLDYLPNCPIIGLGDSNHQFAKQLDSVVEPPVDAEGLIRSITAFPIASAVFVQLLRATEHLPADQSLVMESLAYAALQGGGEHARWLASRKLEPSYPPGQVALHRDGNSLSITMQRPQALNAVDVAMRDGLREAFELAAMDSTIETIELCGEGRAFGVGADLTEFGTTRDPAEAHKLRMITLPAIAAARCADRLEVHVHGLCIGSSLELAAFAHRIEARSNSIFRLGEISMGILPGAGGSVSVPRRIGRHRAALMVLSGRRISARTALDWGLIDAIVD